MSTHMCIHRWMICIIQNMYVNSYVYTQRDDLYRSQHICQFTCVHVDRWPISFKTCILIHMCIHRQMTCIVQKHVCQFTCVYTDRWPVSFTTCMSIHMCIHREMTCIVHNIYVNSYVYTLIDDPYGSQHICQFTCVHVDRWPISFTTCILIQMCIHRQMTCLVQKHVCQFTCVYTDRWPVSFTTCMSIHMCIHK